MLPECRHENRRYNQKCKELKAGPRKQKRTKMYPRASVRDKANKIKVKCKIDEKKTEKLTSGSIDEQENVSD
jgi:hypothetical protein